LKEALIIEEKDDLEYIKKMIENRTFDFFITTHKIFNELIFKMDLAGEISKRTINFDEGLNYIYNKKVVLF